jgi:hypothetical protein
MAQDKQKSVPKKLLVAQSFLPGFTFKKTVWLLITINKNTQSRVLPTVG